MPIITRTCAYPKCGQQFTTMTRDKLYCNVRCRDAQHRARERTGAGVVETQQGVSSQDYFVAPMENPTLEAIQGVAVAMHAVKAGRATLLRSKLQLSEIKFEQDVYILATAKPDEWLMWYDNEAEYVRKLEGKC